MNKKIIGVMLAVIAFSQAYSQNNAPTLKGRMNVSVKTGTIDCDFTLTDIPRIKDYYIRINTGMNIRYFRNTDDNLNYSFEKSYNDTTRDESFGYYLPDSTGKAKFLPKELQFSYTGKFPVIADTLKASDRGDWKGNIAFNGYSIRCDGIQSAWYPVLYDIAQDKMYDKVRYDIEIDCSDCHTIYLNGNVPVEGRKAHFKSDVPLELMLYAGNFKVANKNGTYFLNPDISTAQIKEFGEMTANFKKFYEANLGIKYKYNITYIQTTPVSKKDSWLFVSYPTVVNVGWGQYSMKSFFDKKNGDWLKPYMAHELAHYYFGTYKVFNSDLGDMMREGFAEYLSWQAARKLLNDTIYTYEINKKIKSLKDFQAIPFAKIKSKKEYKNRELYVYYYAPLIFTAIEKEVGMDNMWKWMKTILETPTDFTNYAFMEQILRTTINDDKKMEFIKERYFQSDASLVNAEDAIGNK